MNINNITKQHLSELSRKYSKELLNNDLKAIFDQNEDDYKILSNILVLKGFPVLDDFDEIPDMLFNNNESLKEITIPNSVKRIGYGGFYKCTSLQEITITNSVIDIDKSCFWKCTSLQEIIIPNSVKSIADWCFCDCESLQKITIPNSVTKIGADCFRNCTSIEKITIPNSVKSIGHHCFVCCSPDLVIKCKKGSYAGKYAKENNIKVEYI